MPLLIFRDWIDRCTIIIRSLKTKYENEMHFKISVTCKPCFFIAYFGEFYKKMKSAAILDSCQVGVSIIRIENGIGDTSSNFG